MKKRVFRILGTVFLVIGATFLFNSFSGLTGFVILEVNRNVSEVLGLIFVLIGVIILSLTKELQELAEDIEEEIEKLIGSRRGHRPRRISDAQKENKEARYIFREMYREQHRRYPNTQELKEFIEPYHRTPHGIEDAIKEFKKRREENQ
jgi:hypothetical protein